MPLPDDLAFAYSRFSPRSGFNDLYREANEENLLQFLRRGRGLSYHEFELAMDGFSEIAKISSFAQFHRRRSPLRALKYRFTRDHAFEKNICRARADLHPGFFHKMLDLTLIKP